LDETLSTFTRDNASGNSKPSKRNRSKSSWKKSDSPAISLRRMSVS